MKWYNPDKGFGFVSSGDGEKDVFVHASVLERAGVPSLGENQRVSMKVVKTQKGREALSIALLE
ncbi:MAG: cold-shock protein [Hyphomicrobiaceae bacterium]